MLFLILTACLLGMTDAICDMRPTAEQSSANRTLGDGGYKIFFGRPPFPLIPGLGQLNEYIPHEIYTIKLQGSLFPELKRFKGFILTMHSQNFSTLLFPPVGELHQDDDDEEPITFNRMCRFTVSGETDYETFERRLKWQAPGAHSGCIVFTAMVLVNNERWYAGDGALTKTVCEARAESGNTRKTRKLEELEGENTESKSKQSSHVKLIQKRYIALPDDPVLKAICTAERNHGRCNGYFSRWAFNPQTLKCEPFVYSGCKGNQNNFLTRAVCNKACDSVRNALIREALNVTVNRDQTPTYSLSPSSPYSPSGLRRIPLVKLDNV